MANPVIAAPRPKVKTTDIHVTATDNELYVIATPKSAAYSAELLHLKSGFHAPVDYHMNPAHVLAPGEYTLVFIGLNWGAEQAFEIVLTSGGQQQTYGVPPTVTAPGTVWTTAVHITV